MAQVLPSGQVDGVGIVAPSEHLHGFMPQPYLWVSNCLVLPPACRSILLFIAPKTNALHRHCRTLHFSGSEGPSEHVDEDYGHLKPFPSAMLTVFLLNLSELDRQPSPPVSNNTQVVGVW